MKKLFTLTLLLLLAISAQAQQPTRESLENKKKELSTLEPTITSNKNKIVELEAEINRLKSVIASQEIKIEDLKNEIAVETDEVAFLESPARTILDVTSSKTFVIDYNGNRRYVTLHGVQIDSAKDAEILKVFKKKLIKKSVYIRCADMLCNQVYIYGTQTGDSLNAELVKNGLAIINTDARYDVARLSSSGNTVSSPAASTSSSPSSSTEPGRDVQVKGYYRKDGTYVRPHTRSAPKRKP
jgi:hypothetical protein